MKIILPMLWIVLIGMQIAGVISWPWYVLIAPLGAVLLAAVAFTVGCLIVAIASHFLLE